MTIILILTYIIPLIISSVLFTIAIHAKAMTSCNDIYGLMLLPFYNIPVTIALMITLGNWYYVREQRKQYKHKRHYKISGSY